MANNILYKEKKNHKIGKTWHLKYILFTFV